MQLAWPCLGLLDDPLTPQPRGKGALFPMQPMQPPPENAGLFAMPQLENVLQRSTVTNSQPCAPVYSACNQGGAGGGTCNRSMQRGPVWHDVNHAATDPCSARQTMQIRPYLRCTGLADSPYIHHAQRIARAASGHFKRFRAFRSTPGNAARGIPDRPPGIDTLRLYAVGVEFS